MEVVIVVVLSFILGVFTEKARVEARKELKAMKAANLKAVVAKATAPVQEVKSAPPVKKTQKAPVKKVTKKAVAKKTSTPTKKK